MRAVLSRTASLAAVAAAVLPTTTAPAPAAELGERALERGDRGDDVRALQGTLSTIGLRTVVDGPFGARTAASDALPLRPDPPGDSGDTTGSTGRRERAFPVDGEHTYGDGFGDRPGHDGADVLAACGTPLRAVTGATVRRVANEGSAGRYVVLHDGDSGDDYVYMHMSDVGVSSGERVQDGERIGSVGQTGNATTCHLHFERWTAPGWYEGGSARDPMPLLRSLAAA